MIEKEHNATIKTIRTDNGGKYTAGTLQRFLKDEGIIHETTVPRTPQQNGVAERMNPTLLNITRSILFSSKLKNNFWGEAVTTAAYLRNRSPTQSLSEEITPFEALYKYKPSVGHLRAYGSPCSVKDLRHGQGKLDSRSWNGILVGYSQFKKAWRIWDPSSQQVFHARDVSFDEDSVGSNLEADSDIPDEVLEWESDEPENIHVKEPTSTREDLNLIYLPIIPSTLTSFPSPSQPAHQERITGPQEPLFKLANDANQELPRISANDKETNAEIIEPEEVETRETTLPEPRRTGRTRTQPSRFGYTNLGQPSCFNCTYESYIACADNNLTYKQATLGPDKEGWLDAIGKEMQSLIENKTWTLEPLPPNRKAIGCRWVFRVKDSPTGEQRHKARLVAKGYSQVEGIDYDQTYAPVMRYQSLRMMMALGTIDEAHIHQLDITTAFLYGELEEEIYMQQPEGQVTPGTEHLVCRLKKSIYGLKQSPRCWNKEMHSTLSLYGFKSTRSDPAIYVKGMGNNRFILGLYVDDILLICKNLRAIQVLKKNLMITTN